MVSHSLTTSAAVGILFSRAFNPQSVESQDMDGHAIMVKALMGGNKMSLSLL